MKRPSIETVDLSIGYTLRNNGEKIVHKGINVELMPGELTALIGLNGAGKSTLIRTLAGFQKPLEGSVMWQGKDLYQYTEEQRAQLVGIVLTEKFLAGGLTVFEIVALGRHPHTDFFGRLTDRDKEKIEQAMQFIGVSEMANCHFDQLSDGEKQKVMIAKVFAQECPIILLDEPTAFLDINNRIETMMLLNKMARIGKAILISTHDIDLALQMSDAMWMLSRSKEIACGAPEDIVLDGTFNLFFGNKNMVFDIETGIIRIEHQRAIPVYVKANKTVAYWINNALLRNGFFAVQTPEESDLHIIAKEFPELEFKQRNKFSYTFFSIEELIKRLKLFVG